MIFYFFKRGYYIIIFLFCLLLISEENGVCQEYSFREYGANDGLPQSQTNVRQDSRGFIWISTRNGLSRFDGIDFINYYRKDGLPSNSVNSIFEDRAGNLWAASKEGLSKYTGNGFKFNPVLPDSVNIFGAASATDKPGKNFILDQAQGLHSNKIILFENGIYSDYSSGYPALNSQKFNELLFDTAFSDLLLIDSLNTLWAWKNESLSKLTNRHASRIHYDRGKILINLDDSICEYRNRNFYPHHLSNTDGRPEVLSRSGNSIRYFNGSELIEMNLPFTATSVFADIEGTMWFSSETNFYRSLSPAFTRLGKDFLKTTDLWAICTDKNGSVWLGSLYGDLFEYDGTTLRKRTEFKKLFAKYLAFYKGSRLLSNGEMWFSTNMGVLIWNGSSFSRLKGIPENTQICYIYEDPDNHKIFIGTEKGLFILSGGTVRCIPEYNDYELGVIEGVAKDDSGFYWMSGHNGILKFDGINSIPVKEDILPRAFTFNIVKDGSGGIWVSSDMGLFFKGKADKYFSHGVPEQMNRAANTVWVMDRSHLLVGRTSDLCLIDLDKFYSKEHDYYHFYDKTDGYPGGDCLDNGIVRGNDGSFWILTSQNVIRFNPARLKKNLSPPLLHFTGFYYEGDSLTWNDMDNIEFYYRIPSEIKLKRNQNKIKITYTGISTTNPEKVKYTHMLSHHDQKWSLPSGEREIIYDDLLPGQYSFQLKAINADGVETPEPVILNFSIQPSIRETTIFRIFSVIFILGITSFLTWYFVRKNQKRIEEKRRLKSELSRLQMNSVLKELDPHFTFNVISSIGSLIMKNNREEAYTYITRLSSLLRTVIRGGSTILKPLSEELDFVTNYCELQKLRFGDRFSYNIIIDNNVDTGIELPKMTIQTFVENAIKHGIENRKEGGKIDISLTHKDDSLEIVIRDNGIGRTQATKMKTAGTGYGLKTIRKVFDIMNENNSLKAGIAITDLNETDFHSGTEVVISIPDQYSFRTGGYLNDSSEN